MSGQPLHLSPAECTCFRIRGAARRVTQIYGRHLAPTGLKISQFSLLGFVSAEGPVSIGRLSELLATDRTTLTRNLRPLEERGYVLLAPERRHRSRMLTLTAAGHAALREALPLWEAAQGTIRRRLGERRWPAVQAALAELTAEAQPAPHP